MSAAPVRGAIFASERIVNINRRFGAAPEYLPAYLIQNGRAARPLLLTTDQIRDAAERADANREDCGVYQAPAPVARSYVDPAPAWELPAFCACCTALGLLAGWIVWGGM